MWQMVSVFAGSFDLDAAEAVCARSGPAGETVADLIDGLVAKSILFRSPGLGKARYRLLDTIGEFGLQKLRAAGNEPQTPPPASRLVRGAGIMAGSVRAAPRRVGRHPQY